MPTLTEMAEHAATHDAPRAPTTGVLRVAYTPDSDDAFNFYAWEHGRVHLGGGRGARFARDHITALNRAAASEAYDVLSISSVAYPALADRYYVLSAGSSVGRDYGPALVSQHYDRIEDLRGKLVAVGGLTTTGAALARMYCPGATLVEMPYDRIADAILAARVDAGVMIHEELLFFPENGLRRICCLGQRWCRETGMPLPVGLNVARRALGEPLAREVDATCRASLRWAHRNPDEALAFASTFGHGLALQFVEMFSNHDTLRLPDDARRALRILLDRVADMGIAPRLAEIEVIDGDLAQARPAASGPAELLRLKAEYVMPCVYHFYRDPPQIVASEGSYLIDHAGRRYLDCFTGVTVMSAGHCNPEIIEPAIEQIRTLQHTTSIYLTEPALRLAEQLARIAPGDLKRSFLCASGSEAVEGALLLAALHTGRDEVIAMTNGLHGRTKLAMNVTGLPMWRTDPNPLACVHHVPFEGAAAVEAVLRERCGRVSAVIAEPVLGNGGIVVPPHDYWPAVRRLTREHGALLVLDEIQTGFNRTGRWFACEHWGVVPDVMAMSKAMGNGFPIAAYITTDAIARSYARPGASTYGGNPVCAAAALATIDFHRRHELGAAAVMHGRRLLASLEALATRRPHLRDARGLGLMLGIDVVAPDGAPDAARCDLILESLKDRGVLAGKTGPGRNVLTFLPPLTISAREIGELTHALQDSV